MSEDKYPRITQAQFELWLNSPVTKTYFQCLAWSAELLAEALGNGLGISSSNNDLSMNLIHSSLGEKRGLLLASLPWDQFIKHKMIEAPEPAKEKEREADEEN